MAMLRFLPMTILSLLAAVFASSCIDDTISTSPADLLTFSTDTLSFDTVFTDLGTPTARLLVYNKGKKGVNISEIKFRNSDTRFSINVDGMSGKSFHDIEIRGGDSIYVFVECYIPASESAEPSLTADQLLFITNGVTQAVEVEAYGQNVRRLHAPRVTADAVYDARMPYVVFDSLVVDAGATLTLEPGTKLLFHDKAYMRVYGTLLASGEAGKLIELRGDRLDKVLPNLYYDQMSSQWEGLSFASGSFGNVMEYVDMRSTTSGLVADSCGNLSERKLLLRNSWIHNSAASALTSNHAWIDAYGVIFSESAGPVVNLTGGRHTMVQCTMANYYLFAAPSGAILTLRHIRGEDGDAPAANPYMVASFENSIIYGLPSPISVGNLEGTDVYLRNVLLGALGEDDEHFVACVWDKDPLFLTDRKEYYFNYHVKSGSAAIGAGNPGYLNEMTAVDMEGTPRMPTASGYPVLGAYARVIQE